MITATRRTGAGKRIRDRQRLAHLLAGLAIVGYVYAPGGPGHVLEALVRWVLLPGLVASGVLMWQWPKLRQWRRTRASQS